MKKYQISIKIERLLCEVFEFTTNPKNTHLWIDSVIEERTDTEQVGLGTEYSQKIINSDGQIAITKALITGFKLNEFIEFSFLETTYKCMYIYNSIENGTLLFYSEEAIDDNDLKNPMEMKCFERLKSLLES